MPCVCLQHLAPLEYMMCELHTLLVQAWDSLLGVVLNALLANSLLLARRGCCNISLQEECGSVDYSVQQAYRHHDLSTTGCGSKRGMI